MKRSALTKREKKCKVKQCRKPFLAAFPWQTWCSPDCAAELAQEKLAKIKAAADRKVKKARADDKRQTRAQLEALKTIPELKKEAQVAFNRAIRARDAGLPCISCGAIPGGDHMMHYGRDAGHWRSTGAADHLRFDEDNCHSQCVHCNQYLAGNPIPYRRRLIERIGIERVEALENNNTPIKWTREGLRNIRDTYRRRAKEIEKGMK